MDPPMIIPYANRLHRSVPRLSQFRWRASTSAQAAQFRLEIHKLGHVLTFVRASPQERLRQEEEWEIALAKRASLGCSPLHSHAEALAFKFWSTGR